MRNVMQANGDLTQTVVRLETPFGKPIEGWFSAWTGARLLYSSQ